jgi:hypothetical protein
MAVSKNQILNSSLVAYTKDPNLPHVTNVKEALDILLYTPPLILTFTGGSISEKGTTITSVHAAWTITGNIPTHSSLTDVPGFDINTAGGSHDFTSLSLTTDKTYELTVGDDIDAITDFKDIVVHFTQKFHYGNNANTSISSAQILTLAHDVLTDSRQRTVSIDGGGNYLYVAYPVAYGVAEIWVGGFLDTSWVQNTVSHTNVLGYVENYYTYRSQYVQAGSGISVEIR